MLVKEGTVCKFTLCRRRPAHVRGGLRWWKIGLITLNVRLSAKWARDYFHYNPRGERRSCTIARDLSAGWRTRADAQETTPRQDFAPGIFQCATVRATETLCSLGEPRRITNRLGARD